MAGGIRWKGERPDRKFIQIWRAGCLNMMADVQAKAQFNAPVLTSALRNSARLKATRDGAEVTFGTDGPKTKGKDGSSRVDYALLRHEVNHLHPGTTKYLARAAQEVANSDIGRYFK